MDSTRTMDPFAYALVKHQDLLRVMTSAQMFLFIELFDHLRAQIATTQPVFGGKTAPITLPVTVQSPLRACLSHETRELDDYAVSYAWEALREVLWHRSLLSNEISMQQRLLELFLRFGPVNEIGCTHFYPPTRTYITSDCPRNPLNARSSASHQLDNPKTHPVTVFTIHHGPIPGYTTLLYFYGCKTTYKADYYIRGDQRVYYLDYFTPNEQPAYIQPSKHIFMEWRLSSFFSSGLAFAW